jgi:AcrR family transcriptional regulator
MKSDKTDKRAHILDTAEKLFAEMGYDGASTRMIASKAGVNMAMLSYYFGSKDGLYKSVLERRLEVFDEIIHTVTGEGSPWDKLYACVDSYTETILAETHFQRLINHELSLQQRSDMTDLIIDSRMRTANEVKRLISEGIENGTFRNADVELTVVSIFGTSNYLINSAQIASRILNKDINSRKILLEEIKPRLKKHLHDFLNASLKKHHTQD